jgi:hypothetical protein
MHQNNNKINSNNTMSDIESQQFLYAAYEFINTHPLKKYIIKNYNRAAYMDNSYRSCYTHWTDDRSFSENEKNAFSAMFTFIIEKYDSGASFTCANWAIEDMVNTHFEWETGIGKGNPYNQTAQK